MRASPTRTRPSTAGRTTSTTTSAFSPRVRTSSLVVRYMTSSPDNRQASDPYPQFFLAYRSLCPSGWAMRWDDQRGEFLALSQLGSIKSMPLIPYRERYLPHEVGRVNATLCVTNQFSLGFLRNRFSLFLSIASIIEDIISLPNFLTDLRASLAQFGYLTYSMAI
jgi:hypothetical protein